MTTPVSTSTPCSYAASTSISSDAPGPSMISAPSNGVAVATGDVEPSSDPRKTRTAQSSPATSGGA